MRSVFSRVAVTMFVAGLALGAAADVHAAAVTIRDPAFGLPHVCADNDVNAARQQGYEAARDRIGQFLLVMSVARGTLHRAIGNLGIDPDGDIETRRTGYSRSEYQKMFDAMPADAKAVLLAYCEGVNTALSEMMRNNPLIDPPLELSFFKQNVVAGASNIFGNKEALTQGEGADPFYQVPHPSYPGSGFQFTPELALAFAVLQIRNFGFEGWDEVGMQADLEKLIDAYGVTTGTELWDDRHWMNDPLSPVSVPDSRNPGFGGPLAKLAPQDRIAVAQAAGELQDKLLGRTRLPGYPRRDYSAALEPIRQAHRYKEEVARKWGAWPALGSYAIEVGPGRSATGNPWIGGFPQTGIQVPSIMHYTEIRGSTMKGNGMAFVGGPYVLIGHTDNVAYTTTTAHLKVIDTYIEQLVNGNFDLFKYDAHGTTKDMSKRIELVGRPNGVAPYEIPVFRTAETCSVNGCNGGTRPVLAFSGAFAGTVDSATGNSITDAGVTLTAGELAGGHVAIVDGTGAGQIRTIASNTANAIVVGSDWTVQPDNKSEWVAVPSGEEITAVASETSIWLEEAEAVRGFSLYQQTDSVLDFRAALRVIPSTHNFFAADNLAFNGNGTDAGTGNIYYGTSGFHRVRQTNVLDSRLPLDGTGPEPFAVVSGVIDSATANSLTDTGAFIGKTLNAAGINFTYDNPDDNGEEYVVQITAGNGIAQARRIVSNTNDALSLEYPWGKIPSAGDTYTVYQIWATPEAMNPAEGFTANWNNKQSRANDIMLGQNGRNHRAEVILEQLSLDASIDRTDMRDLNKYVAGVTEPGTPARYLANRIQQALAAHGDCGTIDDDIIAQNDFPTRGREFTDALLVAPAGTPVANAAADRIPDFVKNWATELAADIYGDEYDGAGVNKLTGSGAVGWVVHAIDSAAGDVSGAYSQVYSGDYFNGQDWKLVVRDSFCDYVAAHPGSCTKDGSVACSDASACDKGICTGLLTCAGDPLRACAANADCQLGPCTLGTKNRSMQNYSHPLAGLPCQDGCETPIQFDPTPAGNRGTWEQIVEVGPTITGEFVYPMGQSGFNDGVPNGFNGNYVKQGLHTSTLQPLWRDWRFVPILSVCEDVSFGGDEDGDVDNDGVLDAFERWYYGSTTNDASSDTDADGATLATEYRWGSDPTVADTDQDTVADGSDVAPQDRLCVGGALKKLSVTDSAQPGADKISAKWEVPLNVCIGSDYATACTVDADCGVAGRCRRIRVDPSRDSLRITAGDDSALFDQEIPFQSPLWISKDFVKFSYKDKDGVNGPTSKIKVTISDKKGVVQLSFSGKGFDVKSPVNATQGVVGMSIGTRCFMQTPTNCTSNNGKLSCKAS